MFGTVFRMRPKAGQQRAVEEHFHRWGHERTGPHRKVVWAEMPITPGR